MPKQDVTPTDRLNAFSDGIFGIAMTLLVIELYVPTVAEAAEAGGLLSALGLRWVSVAAFVVSFLNILVFWINHHHMLHLIKWATPSLLALNGLILLFICVQPFTTALLAEHLNAPGAAVASFLYTGANFAVAVLYRTLWYYAAKDGHLLDQNANPRQVQALNRQFRFGPLYYVPAILLSFISVPLVLLVTFIMAAYYTLPVSRR